MCWQSNSSKAHKSLIWKFVKDWQMFVATIHVSFLPFCQQDHNSHTQQQGFGYQRSLLVKVLSYSIIFDVKMDKLGSLLVTRLITLFLTYLILFCNLCLDFLTKNCYCLSLKIVCYWILGFIFQLVATQTYCCCYCLHTTSLL